ncbi:MAG: TlpA disulfide reductase family protein [Myxococcota bacterium]
MTEPTASEAPQNFVLGLIRDWAIAVVVVFGLFVAYAFLFRPAAPGLGPAPAFTLSDLDGAAVTLPSPAGELVVLNFWFTTCPPCRREIPELSRFHQEHPEIPLFGVSTDVGMSPQRLAAESRRLGITYPVLHDRRAEVAGLYGVDSFPTTLVIKGGKVVQAKVGMVDGPTLLRMVDQVK